MRCPKCGAGLTCTRSSDKWWCQFCNLTITVAQANTKSLDQFIDGGDTDG